MVASKQEIKDRIALERYGKFFNQLSPAKQKLINRRLGNLMRDLT